MTMNQREAQRLATKSAGEAGFSRSGAGRTLAVFGAGYVGSVLVRRALAGGWRVVALTRNRETAADLRAAGAEVVVAELAGEAWWSAPELAAGAERLAVTVAAGGGGAEGYRRSYVEGLRSVVGWGARLRRQGGGVGGQLLYTSSTSVYPQGGGVRVTELDAVGGEAETTRALIEAEQVAGQWRGATGGDAAVLRLAGIYGPGRVHLVEQVRSGEVAGSPEAHLNLIFRDDIVDAMEVVWERGGLGAGAGGPFVGEAAVWNVADEGGATKGEVVSWLAGELGVVMPRFSGRPAGARRMVTPDRIIDAARARAVLGWVPRHRTFREGYAVVLRSR
jgi:nucleoside-diphosphate-sugar epimerase